MSEVLLCPACGGDALELTGRDVNGRPWWAQSVDCRWCGAALSVGLEEDDDGEAFAVLVVRGS